MPVSNSATSMGAFVRERRRANRLTQVQLGELAEVGVRFIVDLERGKPTVRLDRVNAVLRVFGKQVGVVDAPREEAVPVMNEQPIRVLFVCLGNICRSPLAEGLFRHHVQEAGLADRILIRSAGTGGWHVGKAPDDRMSATARQRGIDISHQRARQLSAADLRKHDLVLVMDRENLANTRKLAGPGEATSHVVLFRQFDPEPGTGEVPDPYYGGEEDSSRCSK